MSYCTTTEVAGLNPKRTYSATSTPSLTQIQEFIDRIAAEIDTVLRGRGLTPPATAPAELVTYLKQLNTLGAGAMTEQAMFPEATGQMSATSAQVLWRQYRDGLEYLKTGPLASTEGAALPFSFASDQSGSTTEPKDTTWNRPKFGKEREF